MVNLPRPHASSVIDHQTTDTGVKLTYTEKPRQNPGVWLALAVFFAIWIVGLALPINSMVGSGGAVTAATAIWLSVWGGIGVFFIYNLIRQRILGRVQRLVFDADHVVFIPKARIPDTGSGAHPDDPNARPRRTSPRGPARRRPLRISELARTDLERVQPGPRVGVDLFSPSGRIPLARALPAADADYLIDIFKTWRTG
ncbi:MAG: hypothetical protein AAF797_15955 [Planctomycetota bacterium]